MNNDRSDTSPLLGGTSPERIGVERAIYSAVERWTDTKWMPDMGVPRLRNGKLHYERPTLLGGSLGSTVAGIMSAAKIESKANLKDRLARLRSCEAAIRGAAEAFSDLEPSEKAGTWPPNWRETVERRLIDSIGLWAAFPIASEAALDALTSRIAEVETKLATYSPGAGRPRNEAAHRVASELARFYTNVTGRKPTYSENRDGLHGDYTPALRALFDALGWEQIALRGPAEAAVAEITDEHIEEVTRPRTMLLGGPFPSVPRN